MEGQSRRGDATPQDRERPRDARQRPVEHRRACALTSRACTRGRIEAASAPLTSGTGGGAGLAPERTACTTPTCAAAGAGERTPSSKERSVSRKGKEPGRCLRRPLQRRPRRDRPGSSRVGKRVRPPCIRPRSSPPHRTTRPREPSRCRRRHRRRHRSRLRRSLTPRRRACRPAAAPRRAAAWSSR